MSEYTPIETVKFSMVVREGDDSKLNAVRIEEGKFKGLVYIYEDVMMGEETKEGGMNLHFTLKPAQWKNTKHLSNEKEFHQIAGDILVSCLEKGLKEDNEFEIIYREHDSESLDDQRGVHKESITISED
ncbi:uncharacterized protein METZ01_LOCUS396817 [marine metagenome]|uniref:Uncharacterized protein n=1 Tax=marine metagenome TaxID=408172 RepID=A0A382VBV5_9ZZZZ